MDPCVLFVVGGKAIHPCQCSQQVLDGLIAAARLRQHEAVLLLMNWLFGFVALETPGEDLWVQAMKIIEVIDTDLPSPSAMVGYLNSLLVQKAKERSFSHERLVVMELRVYGGHRPSGASVPTHSH